VGEAINLLLQKEKAVSGRSKAGLIITHTGYILDYVNADRGHVLLRGTLACSGNPRELLADIRQRGYEGCVICER